jgi:DNA-binding GntR family transcriptional regulator
MARPIVAAAGHPLVDYLAAAIQARVVGGEIAVGSRLRQEALAAEFGVSRTPIREALRKLQANGVVDLEPHRGAIVRGPTAREIREAYEVRAELEGLAAALAATRIRDGQLRRLREAQRLFRKSIVSLARPARGSSSDGPANDEWSAANDLFHAVIHEAAGNDRLVAVVGEIHRSFPRGLTWAALNGRAALLEENVNEHRAILEAIERRSPREARRRMIAHVRHAGELVSLQFEKHG